MDNLDKFFDQHPAVPLVGLAIVFILAFIRGIKRKPKVSPKEIVSSMLDQILFWWTQRDKFRVRDLLNGGALILGRAGSGKTSSSGRKLMQAIVNNPKSGGLILAAKPEDANDIQQIFYIAGRLNDLIVFDAQSNWRCNFFSCLKNPRDVVTFIMTMSEVLKRGGNNGGGDNNKFYDMQEERTIYNAVAALQAAKEQLTTANLHKFIMSAARTPEEMATPEWQGKYHSQVLDRGFKNPKTEIEAHDFYLCLDFFLKEWACQMDAKTRGNILAGVQGTLHIMNTGLVREMVSGETNCSPQDVLNGKWILVNFPESTWGATGQLISAGWKQLVELAILERKATEASPFVTIWCDEAHQFVTNFDSSFIAQCRSHKGCLVYLTQSVSSFYASMKGENGRHQADAMLANFSHLIVHTSDPETARWCSSKLGKRKEIMEGGSTSTSPESTTFDLIFGGNQSTTSFSTHYESVLQDQAFMIGRTGGPDNDYLADAIVIRSGEPFASGQNYLRIAFSQKG